MGSVKRSVLGVLAAGALVLAGLGVATPASAETVACPSCSPWWHLISESRPTNLSPEGGEGEIVALAENLGDANVDGATETVHITDVLPPGLEAKGIAGTVPIAGGELHKRVFLPCEPKTLTCELKGTLPPYASIEVRVEVKVKKGAAEGTPSSEENRVSITGGGAPEAQIVRPVPISEAPAPFGVEDYELVNEEEGGAPDLQAGSHPFQTTTTLDLNQTADSESLSSAEAHVNPVALAKDLHFNWPPGLIGNPSPIPQCTTEQFLTFNSATEEEDECPAKTAIGVATVQVFEPGILNSYLTIPVPLFNLEPEHGEPARVGFDVIAGNAPVLVETALRSGGNYGIVVKSDNISQTAAFVNAQVTVWGTPGSPLHDNQRGWGCLYEAREALITHEPCEASEEQHPPPFLSLPTSCTSTSETTVEGDSWPQAVERQEQGLAPRLYPLAKYTMPRLDGCNQLPFGAEIKVAPDGQKASEPAGLNVDVHVPQEGQLNPTGEAESNIKTIAVTLPEGVTLNPSAADGLQACTGDPGDLVAGTLGSPGDEVGYTGEAELEPESQPGVKSKTFTPKLPEPLEQGVNFCPDASKVATVKITTPLLPAGQPLEGAVYLASPQNFHVFPAENPFESPLALYIVAEDKISGALVKLPGKVELGGEPGVEGLAPGQIRSTFADNPQLAFEDAEIKFFGGERAPLASPSHCGVYTTNATFTPWSGTPPVQSQSSFEIDSGPGGGPCPPAALPFDASLQSGTTNINAGSFSSLTTTLSRPDGNQNIQSVTLHYPGGLSGLLSGVKLCGEAEANAGTCGPESLIGETIVSVGVGGDPFTVTGGKVYITGPYQGAPFGLSIVNPAKAGPFDLQEGRPVIVRAKIEIDPATAALTIVTGQIPTIVEGFPLQIQHVNVTVNRPGFTFNPTSCAPMEVTGTISSAEGVSSPVSDPFQVANCATLKFTPKFAVATSGKTSKADGASLTAKVSEPNEPHGSQANIAKVKVELPLQLPSRLRTLQKACLARVFEANPAACPPESRIGHATVHTPLLPVPVEGPAIFVSHGGEAFPSLTMVLQGYGVTIDLVGSTYISPKGVTSTTFKTVPDAPFSSFELTLPEGSYSALAANGNLCKPTTTKTVKQKVKVKVHGHEKTVTRKVKESKPTTLVMPNEFVAQDGAVIKQDTTVGVTGCPKAKQAKHRKGKKAKGGKKK